MTTDPAMTKALAVEGRVDQIAATITTYWQDIGIQAAWGTENLNQPRAKIFPGNLVFIRGGVILPGSGGYNATQFGWVGAGYMPVKIARWAAVPLSGIAYGNSTYPGSPRVFCDTSGSLTLSGIPGSLNGTAVDISGWYALD